MSKSELHNWDCDIEKLGGENAEKLMEIAQDIYNTGFVNGKNLEKYDLKNMWFVYEVWRDKKTGEIVRDIPLRVCKYEDTANEIVKAMQTLYGKIAGSIYISFEVQVNFFYDDSITLRYGYDE